MMITVQRSKLVYLAILSFGINFGFIFQLSNLTALFKFLGINDINLPLIWLIPPLTGLIIQPLVGQLSDMTFTPFGKRRPYIIFWSILAVFSFCLLPLFTTFLPILVITLLIDCSLNGSAETMRALTGDTFLREDDRTQAFAMQAIFASMGGFAGASLPFILNWICNFLFPTLTLEVGQIPLHLKLAFLVASFIIFSTVFISMMHIKEKSSLPANTKIFRVSYQHVFRHLWYNLCNLPKPFKQIFLIHGLSWVGIFIFWLYFTLTLAQNIYGLPTASYAIANIQSMQALKQASLDSSIYFSIYQNVSILFALWLLIFVKSNKLIIIHSLALLIGGMGIALVPFESHFLSLAVSAGALGVMWGSIIILPYVIVIRNIAKEKLGVYLGLFNISITAPQIICGLLLSPLYTFIFQGHAGYLLFVAGLIVVTSGCLWLLLAAREQKILDFSNQNATMDHQSEVIYNLELKNKTPK